MNRMVSSLRPQSLRAKFLALNDQQRFMVIFIGALLFIVLTTFNKYGFSVDELKGLTRARRVLEFFGSAGQVGGISGIDMTHGAAPDVIALKLKKLLPLLSHHSRHLVSALFGVAGIDYAYRFASRFIGEWVGVFAASFLAATPMWFGHMFFNLKDIPFATLLLASLYYSLIALTEDDVSRSTWVKAGLAIGLLAGTKLAGLVSLLLVVGIYAACLIALASEQNIRLAPGPRAPGRPGHPGWSRWVPPLPSALLATVLFPRHRISRARQGGLFSGERSLLRNDIFLGFNASISADTCRGGSSSVASTGARQPSSRLWRLWCYSFSLQVISGVRVANGCRHFLFIYPYFMFLAAYPVALMLCRHTSVLSTTRDHWPRCHLCGDDRVRDVPALPVSIFILQLNCGGFHRCRRSL